MLSNFRCLYLHCLALAFGAGAVTSAYAELKALDDDVLSGVSGQAGLTLDLEANINVAEVAYFDDGNGIAIDPRPDSDPSV